jgi:tetratricopeptide (TPR) repeat protein
MPDPSSLWERLKQARIVRILAVYLGASWVVLQVASTVVSAFKLPDWVLPSAIVLMFVGLVVIVATAWVQSLASTTAGEQAGELPTDWQLAPRDAIASLRRGRMPHLTWGRVIAAGVFVMALLFGGAGTYMGLTGNRIAGPRSATASEAADGIAVVPFEVRGAGLEIWREGMMDLLTHGLDGVGGFRTINARTLMARWRDNTAEDAAPDLSMTLKVAKATGARYALEGSVVGIGPSVRLSANIYDVDTGKEMARGQVEGPAADVLRLVDELAVQTMRSLLREIGRAGTEDESAETITTSSLPALRAYLEGEKHYRKGRFADAAASYEEAVAADSTFAIALVRLSETYGWMEDMASERMLGIGKRALAQRHRLSPRHQFIMTGWEALNRRSADGVEALKEAVRKYPDDAGAWFLLAETYLHVGGGTYGTADDIWEALQRATALDPSFAPYYVHLAERALLRGDSALARKTIAQYYALGSDSTHSRHVGLAIPILLGTDQQAAEALKLVAKLPPADIRLFVATFARRHDRFDRDAAVDSMMAAVLNIDRKAYQSYYAGSMGAVARGAALAADAGISASNRAFYHGHVFSLWNVQPPADALKFDVCPLTEITCSVIVGIAFADLGRWPEHQQLRARLTAAADAETDTAAASRIRSAVEILRAVEMRRRGNVAGARELLTRHTRALNEGSARGRLELAWLEADARRPADALRHFKSVEEGFLRPAALYGAATMYEQLGKADSAQAYWARFVRLTEKGDALPRIVEGRNALARAQRE